MEISYTFHTEDLLGILLQVFVRKASNNRYLTTLFLVYYVIYAIVTNYLKFG